MRLCVVSHKECWASPASPAGYATDGGFAFHMAAIAELFDETVVCVPVLATGRPVGEVPFLGPRTTIVALPVLAGSGFRRKLRFPLWALRAAWRVDRQIRASDAVHAPVPGDVGTLGIALAMVHRKRLFVRYCGNWMVKRTLHERGLGAFMEWRSGSRDVMVATGGADVPPSPDHPGIPWLFSTSLRQDEITSVPRPAPSADELRLAIACRQVAHKGTGTVIEALACLRAEGRDVTLDVAGDGPDLDRFRDLARARGVADRVTFHGQLDHDQVLEVLRGADLFVYPTEASEGFPKALLEALALGLPVVSTAVSVIPTLLADGGGIVVEDVRPATVARAVAAIADDPDRYERMSAEAVRIAASYTLEAWSAAIGELLTSRWGLLRNPASHPA